MVPLEPNQGLGPSTSHGQLGPVTSSTPPVHCFSIPSPIPGAWLPSSPRQNDQQGGPLHLSKADYGRELKAERISCCCKEQDFIFLPLILANDLLKRLHAPSSSSLDGTSVSHSGTRTGGLLCYQCTGQWGCPSTAAAKIWFSKMLPVQTKRGYSSFHARLALRAPSSTWLVSRPLMAAWGDLEACSERHSVSLRRLSHPSTTRFTSMCNRHVSRGKYLCYPPLRSWASATST